METLFFEAVARLFVTLDQPGLVWSAAVIEPRRAPAAVQILWRYPERTCAMWIVDELAGDAAAASAALRRAIRADSYQVVALGAAPAGERDGVLFEALERDQARAAAIEQIRRRAAGWPRPPALADDLLLAGLARKLAGYIDLSLELPAPELGAMLLDWRELFDPGDQPIPGAPEPGEARRWANLRRLAAELSAAPQRIGDALALLPARQAQLIRLRRGIGRLGAPEPAEFAAAILQLDPARMPALEAAALDALRAALGRQERLLFG